MHCLEDFRSIAVFGDHAQNAQKYIKTVYCLIEGGRNFTGCFTVSFVTVVVIEGAWCCKPSHTP